VARTYSDELMKDKMGLTRLEVYPKSFMRWLAARHVTIFKKRVQGGIDYKGNRFKIYTNKYMIAKSGGMQTKKGKKQKAYKGISTNRQVYPPNLTLTGQMLRSLKRTWYGKTMYRMTFRGEAGDKADWNKDMGRNIIDDIPTKEKRFLSKLLDKQMKTQFKKLKNVTVTIGK